MIDKKMCSRKNGRVVFSIRKNKNLGIITGLVDWFVHVQAFIYFRDGLSRTIFFKFLKFTYNLFLRWIFEKSCYEDLTVTIRCPQDEGSLFSSIFSF